MYHQNLMDKNNTTCTTKILMELLLWKQHICVFSALWSKSTSSMRKETHKRWKMFSAPRDHINWTLLPILCLLNFFFILTTHLPKPFTNIFLPFRLLNQVQCLSLSFVCEFVFKKKKKKSPMLYYYKKILITIS